MLCPDSQVFFYYCHCSSNHVMKHIECFAVSSKDYTASNNIQSVDRERLLAHQTVSLHPVLDCFITEPG